VLRVVRVEAIGLKVCIIKGRMILLKKFLIPLKLKDAHLGIDRLYI
jgi:hypothetical protein